MGPLGFAWRRADRQLNEEEVQVARLRYRSVRPPWQEAAQRGPHPLWALPDL